MPENIIQIDQHMLETRLDRLVTQKVTEILNAMLDAEADEIAGASRYERSGGWKAYRADHYERRITAKAGTLELKVPKLKGALFESAVVERYRRRGESVEEALIDMYLAGRRCQPAAVGREDALADPLRQTQEGVRRHRLVAHEAVGTRIPLRVHGRRVAQALVGRLGGERERARRRRGGLRRPPRGHRSGRGHEGGFRQLGAVRQRHDRARPQGRQAGGGRPLRGPGLHGALHAPAGGVPAVHGVVPFCWTSLSLLFDYATSPSSRRRPMMLMPNSVLMRLSRYQTM